MSMRMDLKIDGLNDLIRDIKRAGGNAEPLVRAALTNSAQKVQQEARQRAPHRTGTLQRSIMPEIDYPRAEVAVNEKYGIFIEEGTGVYGPNHSPITPRRAKVLAFTVGGSAVFTKMVKGMRARPFFKPGWEASQGFIRHQFDEVSERLVKALAGKGY